MTPKLYSRSHVVSDWKCPRERYLRYEHAHRGVVNGNSSLELFLGTTVHDGLAAMAHGIDIDTIAETQSQVMFKSLRANAESSAHEYESTQYAREQASLVEGLLRGFHRHGWPLIEGIGNVRAIEQEMEYPHDGLIFMSKPDLVVEDATEGGLWYVEYKTTSFKKESWLNQWNTAVQLHSTIRAIEHALNDRVNGVIVQGLYKGYVSYDKQNSPFCYAYQRNGNPPFSKTETIYEYRSGFKRTPTWEMDGGVKAWVAGMPDNLLMDQFPRTPPIYINDELVDNFFKQRAVREKEIQLGLDKLDCYPTSSAERESIMNIVFPQHFESCDPGFGRACSYKRICFGHVVDPLQSGYELRISHHEAERKAHEEAR